MAWTRRDHPLPVKGARRKFWIHCPNCSYTAAKSDFGKDDGLSAEMVLEEAYEHVQEAHPLQQILTIEMLQTPAQPLKLTRNDKRKLR